MKIPTPALFLSLLGLFAWWRNRTQRLELWVVLLPLVSVLFFFGAFNAEDKGVRYLLPVFPFLYIACGAVFAEGASPGRFRWRDVVAGSVIAVSVLTAVMVFPDALGYFNVVAGGSANGYNWLADSNLDWGQDLYRVPAETARLKPGGPIGLLYCGHVEPELYGLKFYPVPPKPVEDVIAVSVNFLVGMRYLAPAPGGKFVKVFPDHLKWLRSYQPVARLGSIWIYDTRRQPGSVPLAESSAGTVDRVALTEAVSRRSPRSMRRTS